MRLQPWSIRSASHSPRRCGGQVCVTQVIVIGPAPVRSRLSTANRGARQSNVNIPAPLQTERGRKALSAFLQLAAAHGRFGAAGCSVRDSPLSATADYP
jgi:hypothetical protein